MRFGSPRVDDVRTTTRRASLSLGDLTHPLEVTARRAFGPSIHMTRRHSPALVCGWRSTRPIGKTIRVHRWGLMIAAGRRRCAYVLPPGTPRRQAEAARLDLLRRGVDQDQLTLFVLGAPAVGACLIAVLGLTWPAVLLAIPLPALLLVVWASRHSVVDRARVVAVEVHATSRSGPTSRVLTPRCARRQRQASSRSWTGAPWPRGKDGYPRKPGSANGHDPGHC